MHRHHRRIVLGLTHRELGEIIGTRRESITTTLGELERKGLLEIDGKEIVLSDMDALREAAYA